MNTYSEILNNTLRKLDYHGIEYVIWKDIYDINTLDDIDIYIPQKFKNYTEHILYKSNWLGFYKSTENSKFIKHYYYINNNCENIHLHIYYKVITGESLIKEYELPIGEELINNKNYNSHFNVWVLCDSDNNYLNKLRHYLKSGSFYSRWKYGKKMIYLKNNYEYNKKELISDINIINEKNNVLPNILYAMYIRYKLKKYCRYSYILLPFIRFYYILYNYIGFNNKKLKNGIIISITGVEATGKSTMVKNVYNTYSKITSVKKYHLGKPYGRIIKMFHKIRKTKNNNFSSSNASDNDKKNKIKIILRNIYEVFISYKRYKMTKKIYKQKKGGCIVITDRYPTLIRNNMDGPKVNKANYISFILGKIEEYYYNKIPPSDLNIKLFANLETSIYRNYIREKDDKETTDNVKERYKNNNSYRAITNKNIDIENNGTEEKCIDNIINKIHNEIIRINNNNNNNHI